MLADLLLPNGCQLELDEVIVEQNGVTLMVRSSQTTALCPDCGQPSHRIHSHYWRAPADLPCSERRVMLCLLVHRFFCDNALCARKTFAQRFPDLVIPYARRTNRLAIRQCQAGLEHGGEAAARTLTNLAMPVSADTVLRLVRAKSVQAMPTPRVLGIDDWAWCKGQRYGTILVDLERHCPVDLLADRSAQTVADWLKAHPGVEIISRDRAKEYINGINQGAPQATQVADRWHLLRNLKDALVRFLQQHRACLYAAAASPTVESEPEPQTANDESAATDKPRPMTKLAQQRQAAQRRRQERYQSVIDLHTQGVKSRTIARQLKMSRATVRRYLNAEGPPQPSQRRKRGSILDASLSYLNRRWAEGIHNASQLYREIHEQGYPGSRSLVGCWAAMVREQRIETIIASSPETPAQAQTSARRPWSAYSAVWLLLRDPATLSDRQQAALTRMLEASPALRSVYTFAQAFVRIVRQRLSKALQPWLSSVIEHKIPELGGFARSLTEDQDAALSALTLTWSNGQVEGQVNRLKLIKRQMYGRAKFDLLRSRVLARSP